MKLLGLVFLLNIIRYVVGGVLEAYIIMPALFGAMEESRSYFNTDFTLTDWVTSYLYNFLMWLTIVWAFHTTQAGLKGGTIEKSLKVFGFALLFFLSVSAIYMNHYSHPRDFYLWNMLDAVLVFTIVAVSNGMLYPWFFRQDAPESE